MKRFYVVGTKTSKSLSPLIFNYWFKKHKIKSKYGYIELNQGNFNKKIKSTIFDKNVGGLNITIPFKQKIMRYIQTFDRHAKQINAVNCVTIKSKIKGSNTDWNGYFRTLPKKIKPKTTNVLLIGYGGAALAIHYVLKKKGFKNIIVVNRSKKKLSFEKRITYTNKIENIDNFLSSADLIINTIPKNPISKKNSKLVKPSATLSDIVYKPKETMFLKNFPSNKKIYGITMLLEQAALCFILWFGFRPHIDKKLVNILEKKIK